MRRFLFLVCLIMMLFSATAFATNVQLNGEIIDFTDSNGNKVEAQIINSRTMVPLRKIFELLGCNVEWEGETQKITATKDNRKIVLQINNKTAQKTIDGKTTSIQLDSAPVIVNDRTLVPLRFIAESLNKQVGWDAANGTAIIIDYTYFENQLKNSSPALYYFLKDNYSGNKNANVTITRKYVDEIDNKYSNTATITANINETKGSNSNQKLKINFAGNNPLMQDILSEKWNNVEADIVYAKDAITHTTTGVLAKMITAQNTVSYFDLGIDGNGMDELEDAFRNLIGVEEKYLNIGTFREIKQEFNKLCDLFNSNNAVEETEWGTKYTWNFNTIVLKYTNAKLKYFDLAKLDNIIFNNSYVRAYAFMNKKIFNYDVKIDELMYDMSEIRLSGRISAFMNGDKLVGTDADITYKAVDDYQESFEYNVRINW